MLSHQFHEPYRQNDISGWFECILDLSPDQQEGLQAALMGGGRQDAPGLPQTLQQEFSLVNLQIRNVNVEVQWDVLL